jgi:hypothetical protein
MHQRLSVNRFTITLPFGASFFSLTLSIAFLLVSLCKLFSLRCGYVTGSDRIQPELLPFDVGNPEHLSSVVSPLAITATFSLFDNGLNGLSQCPWRPSLAPLKHILSAERQCGRTNKRCCDVRSR